MFAYCLNNPVAYSDPSGNFSGDQTVNGGRGFSSGNMGAGYTGSGAGTEIFIDEALFLLLADAIKTAGEQIVAWAETRTGEKEYNNNSVYVLIDPNDNLVKYVGRTNDPKRREIEHRNDPKHPWRENYTMRVLVTGLSKEKAITWEQTLISAFTLGYLENARREIAIKNTGKFEIYLSAVSEIITGVPADHIKQLINGG